MSTAANSEPKYNYHEFRNQYWNAVHAVKGSDMATEHFLSQSFRAAAEECSFRGRSIALTVIGLGLVGAGFLEVAMPLIGGIVGGMAGSPVVIDQIEDMCAKGGLSMFLGFLAIAANGNASLDLINRKQFGEAKDGFPILPDAPGSKRIYDRASEIVREAVRPAPQDGAAPMVLGR